MKRIHQVAKELGLSSTSLLELLKKLGFKVKSPMAPISPKMIHTCKEQLKKNVEDMKLQELERRKIRAKIQFPREKEEKRAREKERAERKLRETMTKIEMGERTKKYKKETKIEEEKKEKKIILSELTSVRELASFLQTDPLELISRCLKLGLMVTINHRLDFETAATITAEYNYEAELAPTYEKKEEKILSTEGEPRSPVVTVMGHVDHGKTALLDYIRHTNVIEQEAGRITQHIGAYKVKIRDNNYITFIDTPGHHAFTAMRIRGAKATDIVVLVIAADEGVKTQTVESLNHARDAGVPIIVAINKIDLSTSDTEKVEMQLLKHDVIVEKHGGNVLCYHISAKTGQGIPELLEGILMQAELLELRSVHNALAKGIIIESKLDKGKGAIATVIVQQGTIKLGDPLIAGNISGKVRALHDERGKSKSKAYPSDPIQIVGFDSLPEVGDTFKVIKDTILAREISKKRKESIRGELERFRQPYTLETIQQKLETGEAKVLKLIIKSDVAGSTEALADSVEHLPERQGISSAKEEIKVQVIHRSSGEVNESDVLLAAASGAIIIAYNANTNPTASKLAREKNIEIRTYRIIYEAIDDIKLALKGLLPPKYEEHEIGRAEIKQIFKISGTGFIAGCQVIQGKIIRGEKARVRREEQIVHEGTIESLKRVKDSVKEVTEGLECGIRFGESIKLEKGDIIEVYEIKEIPKE